MQHQIVIAFLLLLSIGASQFAFGKLQLDTEVVAASGSELYGAFIAPWVLTIYLGARVSVSASDWAAQVQLTRNVTVLPAPELTACCMAVLDLQHLPGRLMMKPGVELVFRGIYFVNAHMPTGMTLPFFADSPGARLVWQDTASYRQVGLAVAASITYLTSLPRPASDPGPQRAALLPPGAACFTTAAATTAAGTVGGSSSSPVGAGGDAAVAGNNSSGGSITAGGLRPTRSCVPYPVSLSYDVVVDVGVDTSGASMGVSYGGYVHVARNHTYWTLHDLSPDCLRLKPQAVCVAEKVSELTAAARSAQEDQKERSKQTMLVVAVVVPVSVAALALALGVWAYLRHSRSSRAAAAAAAAAAATAAAGNQSSADSLQDLATQPKQAGSQDAAAFGNEWPSSGWWIHAAQIGSKREADGNDGAVVPAGRFDGAGDSEHTGDCGVCVFGRGSRRSSYSSGPAPAAAANAAALGYSDGGMAAPSCAGGAGGGPAAGAGSAGVSPGRRHLAPAPAPAVMAALAGLSLPSPVLDAAGGVGAGRQLFGGLDDGEQPVWQRVPQTPQVLHGTGGAGEEVEPGPCWSSGGGSPLPPPAHVGAPAAGTAAGASPDAEHEDGDGDETLHAMAVGLGLSMNAVAQGHSVGHGRAPDEHGGGGGGGSTHGGTHGGAHDGLGGDSEEEEEEQHAGDTVITLRLEAGKVRKALAALAAAGAITLNGAAASAVAAAVETAASTPPSSGRGGDTGSGSGSAGVGSSGEGGLQGRGAEDRGVGQAAGVPRQGGRGAGAAAGGVGGGGVGGALEAWVEPVALTAEQQDAQEPAAAGPAAAAAASAAAAAGAAECGAALVVTAAQPAVSQCAPAGLELDPPGSLHRPNGQPAPIVSLELAPLEDAPTPRVAPALPQQQHPRQTQLCETDISGAKADETQVVGETVGAAVPRAGAAPAPGSCAASGSEGTHGERASSGPIPDPVAAELEQLKRRHAGMRDVSLRIKAVLGTGGFGTVYLGDWQGLECAIKVLVFGGSREARKAALREAALCTSINHPNVAATYLVDLQPLVAMGDASAAASSGAAGAGGAAAPEAQPDASGHGQGQGHSAATAAHHHQPPPQPHGQQLKTYRMYIIQEFCDAGTLRGLIASGWLLECEPGGPAPPPVPGPEPIFPRLHPDYEREAVAAAVASGQLTLRVRLAALYELALGIARALAHLHSKSIVHSDLTPNNILLKRDPSAQCGLSVKVADFGLSVVVPDSRTHLSNRLCGSPFYIAPEVCALGRQSTQSDMFSYGVVLWELYMGTAAGQRDLSTGRMCYHPAFPNLPTDCPVQYHRIVQWCLQRDPARRPAAAMVAAVLRDQLIAVLGLQPQGWGSGGAAGSSAGESTPQAQG